MQPILAFALFAGPAAAADTVYTDTFDSDLGRWSGGRVEAGRLVVEEGVATLSLGPLLRFEAELRLTKTDAGALGLEAGDARWAADYLEGGGLSLGGRSIPFPEGHRELIPDTTPTIEPGAVYWYGANALHCEVIYDAASATWLLYWTGEMGSGYPYRQIGLATSPDGVTWTDYPGNPVLTIDYDRSSVDGIHVHMPTVTVGPDGVWHMYYACYQNDVGNRICHATSADGYAWSPEGVVLDRGADGEFDSGSLRMPDVLLDSAGLWHMLYNGTDPEQHYGPTGYATSADGWTWEKHGAITEDETRLQGGGMVETVYGVEQWWNCADVFCYSVAELADLQTWADWPEPVLSKGWADWSSGYIQAPSVHLEGNTYHLWFNAYDYAVDDEVIAHARSAPLPGQALTLSLRWDGAVLRAQVDGGPVLETPLAAADALTLTATGQVELDELTLTYALADADTGATDTGGGEEEPTDSGAGPGETDSPGPVEDSADPPPGAAADDADKAGCGCSGAPPPRGWATVGLGLGLALLSRRARPRPDPR